LSGLKENDLGADGDESQRQSREQIITNRRLLFEYPEAMLRVLSLVMAAVATLSAGVPSQVRGSAPSEASFYAVSYVEAMASAASRAAAALKQYRDAGRRRPGCLEVELFEQIDRPGHFAVVESWRDQQAFDSRDAAAQKQLADALQAIRVSGYDERPYKALSIGAKPASPARQAIAVVTHVDTVMGPQVPDMLRRLAETSRRDEGNLRFDVVQSAVRPNHFTVIEAWQSQKALDAHAAASHTRQYRDELQPLTGSPLDERLYRVIE
jgi:quinol monooxygenase YgiN